MKSDKSTYYANRGVKRNRRPLKNIVYLVDVVQLKSDTNPEYYEKFKYKEEGYLVLNWYYESKDPMINFHGFITPDDLKKLLDVEQCRKFGMGKRKFIIQRRVNGKNI